jgi:hypothetical protein
MRIGINQLLWYMPTGDPAKDDEVDQPAISVMVSQFANPLTVRYSSFEARDKELERLDDLLLGADPEVWSEGNRTCGLDGPEADSADDEELSLAEEGLTLTRHNGPRSSE